MSDGLGAGMEILHENLATRLGIRRGFTSGRAGPRAACPTKHFPDKERFGENLMIAYLSLPCYSTPCFPKSATRMIWRKGNKSRKTESKQKDKLIPREAQAQAQAKIGNPSGPPTSREGMGLIPGVFCVYITPPASLHLKPSSYYLPRDHELLP